MSEPALLYEKREGIAYLTFNRPQVRNALSPEAFCRLADAWQDYAADDSLRVAIITGAGDRAFTAGADLGTFIPLLSGARTPEDEWDWRVLKDSQVSDVSILRGFTLTKPVIAAINGFCLGAGTELIQATDLRIAAEQATFALTEVMRGFMPVGLVNEVVPADQVMPKAEELARKIAANGPVAVRKIKETVLRSLGVSLEEGFAIENENARLVLATEDAKEGPRAFMEKRSPQYVGR